MEKLKLEFNGHEKVLGFSVLSKKFKDYLDEAAERIAGDNSFMNPTEKEMNMLQREMAKQECRKQGLGKSSLCKTCGCIMDVFDMLFNGRPGYCPDCWDKTDGKQRTDADRDF